MLPTLKDFSRSKPNIIFKDNDIMKRLSILSMSARYDNSCSSSGGKRETHPYGLGNSHLSGICHSWASDGRCVSLLKILMTNICINDCKYCINRIKNDVPRAILSPQEIATLTVEFYRRNYIEGLFLSSGIVRNPDYTMELMLNALRILRFKNYFNGYIHLKIIPGASGELVEEAYKLADRVSSNLELPTEDSLRMLAPDKNFKELYSPLQLIRDLHNERKQKASASTQLIIGATPDTDKTILSLSDSLYKKKMVRRVYYSAYIPVNKDSELPVIKEPPFLREHRLYQADWLLRFYGFVIDEIFEEGDNISLVADPKLQWALRHLDFFPVEITKADYYELLRIPGIGPISARKIIKARKYGEITEEFLKKLGVPLKRAKYFLTIKGKPIVKVSKTESRYLEERNLSLFN
ncbi:putative DNA modification/repair radical SAM protein [Thermodesulfovibrio sp.]|uniref:putative DNA modification/repair radical SAM protein n=2 Tax=Thermodesulfovibrio TaxID=28261 RepID=UPI0026052BEA|nr:putative DNA modification/repair radical SAM protein [Thermodesulfovibrio sp.]